MAIATQIDETATTLKMSYEEFLAWADEDTIAEWVDGEVIVAMPPKKVHQMTSGFLFELLSLFVRLFHLGEVHFAPFEFLLRDGGPSREPDIFFLTNDHLDYMTEDKLIGPPDLIIEIVSKESVRRDRDIKVQEYATAGVPEYWIIDPRAGKHRADFLRLDETGSYRIIATEDDKRVESAVLPGFWLRPDWLWQTDTLKPLTCCLQIEGVAEALLQEIQTSKNHSGDQ